MKHSLFIAVLLGILCLPLLGQDITATFTPSSIQVNEFGTASFDPVHPESQPVITTLRIHNNLGNAYRFNLKLEISWNGIALTNATYLSDYDIGANADYPLLTNRDLITTEAGGYFHQIGSAELSLQNILENSDLLRAAVMSGFFPDGALMLKVSVKPETAPQNSWSDVKTFTINVRNAGVINLSAPGLAVGQTPPSVDVNPPTFTWNTISTGFNDYYLTIREFPPNNPPTASNVETMGTLFYQSANPIAGNSFSEFLPYTSGNYYAWQLSTELYNETYPHARETGRTSALKSSWFVFRYVTPDPSQTNSLNELQAVLLSLQKPEIVSLFDQGYSTLGELYYDGRTYTGQEAVDLVRELLGKSLYIEIKNQ